jgi:hypothetical protein
VIGLRIERFTSFRGARIFCFQGRDLRKRGKRPFWFPTFPREFPKEWDGGGPVVNMRFGTVCARPGRCGTAGVAGSTGPPATTSRSGTPQPPAAGRPPAPAPRPTARPSWTGGNGGRNLSTRGLRRAPRRPLGMTTGDHHHPGRTGSCAADRYVPPSGHPRSDPRTDPAPTRQPRWRQPRHRPTGTPKRGRVGNSR